MAYRNGNYTAFYVDEPSAESNLAANATKDFVYYNLLRVWKGADDAFPFIDSHAKNYNVRDSSNWDATLKPRIHDRLNNSKNIILFLSSITRPSRALREEIEFGLGVCGLPVVIVYPEYKSRSEIIDCDSHEFRPVIRSLWDKLPVFKKLMDTVPTLHIPIEQNLVRAALSNPDFMVQSKIEPVRKFFLC